MAGKSSIISVIVTGAADGLKKAFKEGEDAAGSFGDGMKKAGKAVGIAGLALGAGAVAALPGLFDLGNELQAMGAKAKTVFGDSLGDMQKWAAENNRALGLSKEATLDLATSTADLLKPMGFTETQAASMSKEFVGLSGALSAWSNGSKSSAEVSEILTKAVLGETDGLKALGIAISADEINARLAKDGKDKLTGAALAQAKALTVQTLITEKSTDAQKAWTDGTSDGVKKQNELKARTEELKASLANGLAPAFDKVISVILEDLIPAVSKTVDWFKEHQGVAIALGVVVGTVAAGLIAFSVATTIATVATNLAAVATGIWSAAQWLLNAALTANPIGIAVLAIAALVAGIIIAYNKVDWFRDAINWLWDKLKDTFGWVQDKWPLLLAILTGPFGLAVLAISRNFDTIKDGIRDTINWVIRAWNNLSFKLPEVDTHIPGVGKIGGWSLDTPNIPELAQGGIVPATPGGRVVRVAEAGQAEAIIPLSRLGSSGGGGGGGGVTVNIHGPVYGLDDLDRKIVESLARAKRNGSLTGVLA